MNDFVNSVTEAQMKLHADMRWSTLPVHDPSIKRRFRLHWMIAGFAIASLCLLTFTF